MRAHKGGRLIDGSFLAETGRGSPRVASNGDPATSIRKRRVEEKGIGFEREEKGGGPEDGSGKGRELRNNKNEKGGRVWGGGGGDTKRNL